MSTASPIRYRNLGGGDLVRATELAAELGAHGVYLRNALESTDEVGDAGSPTRALLGCDDPDGLLHAVAWFGARGNLMIGRRPGARVDDDGALLAAVRSERSPWRIALGPDDVIDGVAAAEARPALVHRDQHYYAFPPGFELSDASRRDDVRLAQRADTRAMVEAALELNASDLNVARWRVHRGWLRDSVRRRQREERSYVIGPVGSPWCKLDIGSQGPAGAVIEGVYTFDAHRGQGLATALVATVGAALLQEMPQVCLHVAADNVPARRAYERAGMVEQGRCRLLLLG